MAPQNMKRFYFGEKGNSTYEGTRCGNEENERTQDAPEVWGL